MNANIRAKLSREFAAHRARNAPAERSLADARTSTLALAAYAEHERVKYYLDFFQGPARSRMAIWLERLPVYESMVRQRFEAVRVSAGHVDRGGVRLADVEAERLAAGPVEDDDASHAAEAMIGFSSIIGFDAATL